MCQKLRRLLFVFLLLSFSLAPLFMQDSGSLILVPKSELISWQSELAILKINLQNRLIEIEKLQQNLNKQTQSLVSLRNNLVTLQNTIDNLLNLQIVSDQELAKISKDYQAYMTESQNTLAKLRKQNENKKYWVTGAFFLGFGVGMFGDDVVDNIKEWFK